MSRYMIACFKGQGAISFPADWVKGGTLSTAQEGNEARIKFPNGTAFGVKVNPGAPQFVRVLSDDERRNTLWGAPGEPWVPYNVTKFMGCVKPYPLEELLEEG